MLSLQSLKCFVGSSLSRPYTSDILLVWFHEYGAVGSFGPLVVESACLYELRVYPAEDFDISHFAYNLHWITVRLCFFSILSAVVSSLSSFVTSLLAWSGMAFHFPRLLASCATTFLIGLALY
jgi:hypothetical protein